MVILVIASFFVSFLFLQFRGYNTKVTNDAGEENDTAINEVADMLSECWLLVVVVVVIMMLIVLHCLRSEGKCVNGPASADRSLFTQL